MATKVLDSWVSIALFNEEPVAEQVEKALDAATAGQCQPRQAYECGQLGRNLLDNPLRRGGGVRCEVNRVWTSRKC